MSLSAGELADRIRRPGGDTRAMVERLKHLQRLGLLQPVAGPSGTGHHYRYEELAAVDAAILSAIIDAGASVQAITGDLIGALAKARPAIVDWDLAGRKGSLFLVLSSIAGQPFGALVSEVYKHKPVLDPGAEVSMIVNLSQACAHLPYGILQEAEIADRVEARIEKREVERRAAGRSGRKVRRGN